MKEQVLTKLNAVINTLEQVAVSGRENWDYMRGCVIVLEELSRGLLDCEILAPQAISDNLD